MSRNTDKCECSHDRGMHAYGNCWHGTKGPEHLGPLPCKCRKFRLKK